MLLWTSSCRWDHRKQGCCFHFWWKFRFVFISAHMRIIPSTAFLSLTLPSAKLSLPYCLTALAPRLLEPKRLIGETAVFAEREVSLLLLTSMNPQSLTCYMLAIEFQCQKQTANWRAIDWLPQRIPDVPGRAASWVKSLLFPVTALDLVHLQPKM